MNAEWTVKVMLEREFIPFFGFIILFLLAENNQKIGRTERKLLRYAIFIGLIDLVFNELEYFFQTFTHPTVFRLIMMVFGYVLRPLMVYLLILISDSTMRQKKFRRMLILPFVICLLCVSTCFVSDICFRIDCNNHFHRGPLGFTPHIVGIVYMLIFSVIVCRKNHQKGIMDRSVSIAISVFVLLTLAFESFDVVYDIMRTVIMFCTFTAYVQVQNIELFKMIDDIPGAVGRYKFSPQGCEVLSFNNAMCEMIGVDHETYKRLTSSGPSRFQSMDRNLALSHDVINRLRDTDTATHQFEMETRTGMRWFQVSMKVTERIGEELYGYAVMIDITQEKHQEEALMAREKKEINMRYQNTMDSLVGEKKFYLQYDITDQKIIRSEGGLISQKHLEGKTLQEVVQYMVLNHIDEKNRPEVFSFLDIHNMQEAYDAGEKLRSIEGDVVLPDGERRWYRLTNNLDVFDDQHFITTLIVEDLTAEHEESLTAKIDALTGLMTRRYIFNEIGAYLQNDGRDGTHALIMLDMDNLKSVNDHLGHQFGDMALKDFADTICRYFRQEDYVGRVGGDEFFVFVKNIDIRSIEEKMPVLINELMKEYTDKDIRVSTSASAGVTMYYGNETTKKSLDTLYGQADAALYKAKAKGKKTFVIE